MLCPYRLPRRQSSEAAARPLRRTPAPALAVVAIDPISVPRADRPGKPAPPAIHSDPARSCPRSPRALPAICLPVRSRTMPDVLRLALARALCRLAAVLLAVGAAAPAARGEAAKPGPKSPHPVIPGFERFFTSPKADVTAGGQLLLGELSCTSCHKADAAQEALAPRKPAPILDGVGARVRRSFLRKFLSDPHAVKPGTAMPELLAGLPERERS